MAGLSSGVALLLGIVAGVATKNPYIDYTRKYTSRLLAWSIVGLGAGVNLSVVAEAGLQGIGYTFVGILATLLVGTLLGRVFGCEKQLTLLICCGTAICGGSAIAAVSATIGASAGATSVSLATVFLLNALALYVFPYVGNLLELTQSQFGLWCALAIHDTSSVVGAALGYGSEALNIATTVKLSRALWIIPLCFALSFRVREHSQEEAKVSAKKPWFILGFLLMSAIVTTFPELTKFGEMVAAISRRVLIMTLYLIGTGLTLDVIKRVGARPLILGVVLWILVGVISLAAIMA